VIEKYVIIVLTPLLGTGGKLQGPNQAQYCRWFYNVHVRITRKKSR